jgi:nitrite reductase (NADH) large subunit
MTAPAATNGSTVGAVADPGADAAVAADVSPTQTDVLVIGNGMVGHHFVEEFVARRSAESLLQINGPLALQSVAKISGAWSITVVGEEPLRAYDRVHLSSFFDGKTADDLLLGAADLYEQPGVELVLNDLVVTLDLAAKTATTASGRQFIYGHCVLATGSFPFVPPIVGIDTPGVFVYRTIDDLDRTRAYAATSRRGVVVGGGLLGLEAANALRLLGLETTVVEFAPRLMAVQLDDGGAKVLRQHVEGLGIEVRTSAAATAVLGGPLGLASASGVCGAAAAVVGGAARRQQAQGRPALGADADGAVGGLAGQVGVTSGSDVDEAGVAVACSETDSGLAESGRFGVTGLALADGDVVATDLVVFAAGVRPRDQLGRDAGLVPGARGGIVVDNNCVTSDASVSAIGEVACHEGRVYGLVAPGYRMADVVAARLTGTAATPFEGADMSTKLKLLGADVASVGDPHFSGDEVILSDPRSGVYSKVILAADSTVVGAVLVGDTSAFMPLVQALRNQTVVTDPLALLRPTAAPSADGPADSDGVCSCHNVNCGTVRAAVCEGFEDVAGVKACTKAGTGCGSCVPLLQQLIDAELAKSGKTVVKQLCRHFAMSRPELFEVVRASRIRTFAELIARHGNGQGCEICKPTAASIFASLGGGYILDGEQASLQDSNDHFLANLQKDGSYSVVPRVPGGEITPGQLIAIGEVARDFDLYSKITGGQRIDLFGARVEQLPKIWERLIEAGMESGHAYGKSLRTVKSCVGTAWCRYGVQDSTTMAIDLELRYRGLRAPHKIKMAVSGCARECAEAQSKDVGVIATERGWNLYVGGNGGMRPAHAELLAEDLDDAGLIRAIDRYLMWYLRTAERLERTATWQRKLPGGIDFVRRVVMDDELGLAVEFEAQMAEHVATYACEWTETLASPERLAHFTSFVNTDLADPTITPVTIRGQRMPAGASR